MAKRGNGEGSIRYDKKRKEWVAQYTAGRKDNGKLNRKSIYGRTRTEVSEKLKQRLAEVANGTHIDNSSITLIEIIDICVQNKRDSNSIRLASYRRNIQTRNKIAKMDIANKQIQKITLTDITSALNDYIDYSNSTIDKIYGLIKQAYNYATLHSIINKNYFLIDGAINKPKSLRQDSKIEALTIEQQKLFVNYLDKYGDIYKDVFLIAIYSGMRIGEILALTSNDIDIENKRIIVSKTLTRDENDKTILGDTTKTYSGTREVPILDSLMPIMSNLSSQTDFLFKQQDNDFITPSTINAHMKRICKNAGIECHVNTHMLRHTFATRCIEAGMPAIVLQKILGHKSVEITLNTYTSVFDKYKQDEISKVEQYLNNL